MILQRGGLAFAAALFFSIAPARALGAPVVESVEFDGVTASRQPIMRRLLTVATEAPLDEDAVEESRLRLMGTGVFRSVEPRLRRGSARGRVVLVFQCVERHTFSVDHLHFGHARPTPFWLGAEVSDVDPFGWGFGLSAGLVTSGEQTAATLGYLHRNMLGGPFDLDVRGRFTDGREPFVGPRSQRLGGETVSHIGVPYRRGGGEVLLGWALEPLTRISVGLSLEGVSAELPPGAEQIDADGTRRPFDFDLRDGGSLLSAVEMGFVHDRRDDPAHPMRGQQIRFSARTAAGDYAYLRLAGAFEQLVPLGERHVIRLHLSGGVILGDAPFFDRFFVGDLHPYLPPRALGVNFARRRGPLLLGGTLDEKRYETIAGRVGVEYRFPLNDPHTAALPVELFVGGVFLGLSSVGTVGTADPLDREPFPFDFAVNGGVRLDSDYGVMRLTAGSVFQGVDP